MLLSFIFIFFLFSFMNKWFSSMAIPMLQKCVKWCITFKCKKKKKSSSIYQLVLFPMSCSDRELLCVLTRPRVTYMFDLHGSVCNRWLNHLKGRVKLLLQETHWRRRLSWTISLGHFDMLTLDGNWPTSLCVLDDWFNFKNLCEV